MKARMNLNPNSGVYQAMLALETYVRNSSPIEASLLQLVRMRASQINGCAYCLDMHSKDARSEGEREQRLYCLPAWRETPFYTERERAALEWTEAATLVSEDHVRDEIFERARRQFSEEELAHLTLAVVAINGWNRFAISFRAVPGAYQPGSIHSRQNGGAPMRRDLGYPGKSEPMIFAGVRESKPQDG